MYPPAIYTSNDNEFTNRIISENNFAVMTSILESQLIATHLPFIFKSEEGEKGALFGHIAASNPHVQSLKVNSPTMVVFNGAHAYISASWYDEPERRVPTWNYESVKVRGRPEILDRSRWMAEMTHLTQTHEPDNAWQISKAEEYAQRLMSAIVYFKLNIEDVEGISKMSNNKSASEIQNIIKQLRLRGENGTADVMEALLKREESL